MAVNPQNANDFTFCSSVSRTFASGKTEKMIMQCLRDLGFPSGKVSGSVQQQQIRYFEDTWYIL